MTLELGLFTEIEQRRKLVAEIDQDRFTRIDRAMLAEAEDRFLYVRHEPDDLHGQADRTLRLRRLRKLGDMGLATERGPGVWELPTSPECWRAVAICRSVCRCSSRSRHYQGHWSAGSALLSPSMACCSAKHGVVRRLSA